MLIESAVQSSPLGCKAFRFDAFIQPTKCHDWTKLKINELNKTKATLQSSIRAE